MMSPQPKTVRSKIKNNIGRWLYKKSAVNIQRFFYTYFLNLADFKMASSSN